MRERGRERGREGVRERGGKERILIHVYVCVRVCVCVCIHVTKTLCANMCEGQPNDTRTRQHRPLPDNTHTLTLSPHCLNKNSFINNTRTGAHTHTRMHSHSACIYTYLVRPPSRSDMD